MHGGRTTIAILVVFHYAVHVRREERYTTSSPIQGALHLAKSATGRIALPMCFSHAAHVQGEARYSSGSPSLAAWLALKLAPWVESPSPQPQPRPPRLQLPQCDLP